MSQPQLLRKAGKGARDRLLFPPGKEQDPESAPAGRGLDEVSDTPQLGTFRKTSFL